VIELLRRHPNLKDIASPESPLLAAARWNPELCRLLADSYNFDVVDWEQPGDATALHVATHRGTEETTATLIELMKARGLNLDVTDVYSCTPLHYAVMAGCPAKMRLLLEGGCDVNKMDKRGVTPLAYAAVIRDAQNNESYRTDIVNDIRLITEHASKSNFVDLSVQRGASAELFDLLINHGANVRCDRHALLLAAAVGSLDATFLTIRAAATQGLFGDLSKTKEQGKLRSLTVKRKHPMRTRSSKRLCQEPPVAGKERP
jgi:ankyrin repeat protein